MCQKRKVKDKVVEVELNTHSDVMQPLHLQAAATQLHDSCGVTGHPQFICDG